MARWGTVLATKCDYLNSIPRAHRMGERTGSSQSPPSALPIHTSQHTRTCMRNFKKLVSRFAGQPPCKLAHRKDQKVSGKWCQVLQTKVISASSRPFYQVPIGAVSTRLGAPHQKTSGKNRLAGPARVSNGCTCWVLREVHREQMASASSWVFFFSWRSWAAWIKGSMVCTAPLW